MKRTLFAAALSFMAAAAFSFEIEKPFFSGTTGFFTSVARNDDKDSSKPTCSAESYFAGLFDFSGKFFIRGEFYSISNSMFEDEIHDKNAAFRIEELSATYKVTGDSLSQYFSVFKGNFEPFGSDIFLQRHFGVAKISSNLTESYHGIEGTSINPLYAFGANYTIHTEGSNAFGLSFYKDKLRQAANDNSALNLDLRYAGVFDYATIDVMSGLVFPISDDENNEDDESLLTINEIQIHGGINALFGRKKSFMLYTQFGVDGIYLKQTKGRDTSVNLKNFYILIEPRIPIADCYFNPSAFNFPAKSAADMVYLRLITLSKPAAENILGFNFNLVNENLYLGTSRITAGIHGTIAMTDINNSELKEHPGKTVEDAEKRFLITPYANMEVFGGNITASVSIDTKEFSDSPSKALACSVGFKTSF
ncbi:hypothetical protein [Treponema sp.]|uniref:hypothetical protein n=1 Tax=Treponema sp. TaxID=166 RepID=UPI00298DFD56|nr:hypothetical protein [Treponema sp.]MCQ2241280.1 hypothetical protein [Treponema sp.]